MGKRKYVLVARESRIKRLEEDYKLNLSLDTRREYVSTDIPLKTLIDITRKGDYAPGTGKDMAGSFLMDFHRIIMDWELNVDENATIPEILEAAKEKQVELLTALEE